MPATISSIHLLWLPLYPKDWGTVNATLEQVIGITKLLLILVVTSCILQYVMAPAKLVKQLAAQEIAAESFQPYGQVIHATIDRTYDATD